MLALTLMPKMEKQLSRTAVPPYGGISDWSTLREVAAQGYSDAILCLASIEIVERSNRDSVLGPLNENEATKAARLMVDATLFRVQIFIVRAFAPVRYPDDLHLRAAIEFLKYDNRVTEEQQIERRSNLEMAIALFDAAAVDQRLEPLKHMRDKMLAHWARPNESIPKPRYVDLFSFAKMTCSIWEELSFGAGTVMIELDNQIDAYREAADDFWSIWEKK